MVATSDGRLLGAQLKPKFNALYDKVVAHRANRQRQGLHLDSPRLAAMESRLTGMVKTTFRGQTHPSRRSLPPRWSHPERAIPGTSPGQFFRCAHHRARTVEPGAHRGRALSPHSPEPGCGQMGVLSGHGLGNGTSNP
jgi:hypothetical protein